MNGRRGRTFVAVLVLLAAIGLVSRVAPLLDHEGRLLEQFPTEDGYLMLTIARNIALGKGMSIADGTIPTNGTQPLATYLWAACFKAVGGEKAAGVAVVLVIEILISSAVAVLLLQLGRRVFSAHRSSLAVASLGAAIWYASPMVVQHTMNALESGLYVLALLLILLAITKEQSQEPTRPHLGRWAVIGFLLGLAFLVRNDAILLCCAVGAAHLINALPQWRGPFWQRVAELTTAGAAALALAVPWLIHNLVGFGNIIPISGQSESLDVAFGENLLRTPPILFEYLTLVLPIPLALEGHPAVVGGCGAIIAVATAAIFLGATRWSDEQRTLLVVGGLFTLALSVFYGLHFGAGYFMSRYLLPVSPFLALLWAGAAMKAWRGLRRRYPRPLECCAAIALIALVLGLNVRIYLRGDEHMHFQVVEWVSENVPAEVWVGAVQTGTLGFFHDRTINLDGKVNPEALEARRERRIPRYVIDKDIQYLVDWVGIGEWIELPDLNPHFELVVNDSQRNLAVLRRRGAPSLRREGAVGGRAAGRGA